MSALDASVVEGRTLSGAHRLTCDVVVVGTGAAGATVAVTLADAGWDVVMLEEGARLRESEFTANLWKTMKTLFRDLGASFLEGRSFIPVLQGRCVGGGTVINSAIVWRVPEDVHGVWLRRDPGLSAGIPYADLERHWAVLERDLGVAPTDDAIRGHNSRLLALAAERLGYRGRVIPRNVVGCEGQALCLQGCPNGRKQSTAVTYVPRALRAGARLFTDARVDRVVTEGGRASGVQATLLGGDPERPATLEVTARRAVVLAASALQSPGILLKSGLDRLGPVGQHFMCHPGVSMVGVYDAPVDLWSGATQGYEIDHFRPERMKIESIALPPELMALRMPGVGQKLARWLPLARHMALWGAQVRSRAEGQVRLGGTGVRVRFTQTAEDLVTIRLGLRVCAEACFASGARSVLPGIHGLPEELTSMDEVTRWLDRVTDVRQLNMIATHLFGTLRMGTHPDDAVVNPFGEAHRLPRLYVADSSVFPSNLGVNPQHTIMGVARQIAEHVLARA